MNKITKKIVDAFNHGQNITIGNSYVQNGEMYLFDNCIAKFKNDELWITTCGWNTLTTRRRLNGLNGVNVYQKNKQLFLNGNLWDGDWIKIDD